MWPGVVVLPEPVIDDDLGLRRCCEPFRIENLTAKGSVEAFVVAVLPRRSGIDTDGFDADPDQPFLHRLGDELGTIV